jgi:hypothetical protein
MSLKLSKNNAPAYDYYSEGDGTDPVSIAVTLDGSGDPATIAGSPTVPVYLVAVDDTGNIGSYTDIVLSLTNEETGLNYELSDDNAIWAESLNMADMDVSADDQVVQIYVRCSATNDGSILTNNYTAAKIAINATENP